MFWKPILNNIVHICKSHCLDCLANQLRFHSKHFIVSYTYIIYGGRYLKKNHKFATSFFVTIQKGWQISLLHDNYYYFSMSHTKTMYNWLAFSLNWNENKKHYKIILCVVYLIHGFHSFDVLELVLVLDFAFLIGHF